MKNKAIIFVLIACFGACSKINKPKKPDNLISKNEMVNLLIDMNLFVSAKGSNKKQIEELGILPEEYIYRKYNIDSTQFASSNAYYAHHVEIYQEIYDKVNDSLTALKVFLEKKEDEERKEKKKQDSIRKAKGITINDSIVPIINNDKPRPKNYLKPRNIKTPKSPVKLPDSLDN